MMSSCPSQSVQESSNSKSTSFLCTNPTKLPTAPTFTFISMPDDHKDRIHALCSNLDIYSDFIAVAKIQKSPTNREQPPAKRRLAFSRNHSPNFASIIEDSIINQAPSKDSRQHPGPDLAASLGHCERPERSTSFNTSSTCMGTSLAEKSPQGGGRVPLKVRKSAIGLSPLTPPRSSCDSSARSRDTAADSSTHPSSSCCGSPVAMPSLLQKDVKLGAYPPPPCPSSHKGMARPASPGSPLSSIVSLLGLVSGGSGTPPHGCRLSHLPTNDSRADVWDSMFYDAWNTDVVICCQHGYRIPAHSAVLVASSPVFKQKLEKSPRPGHIFIEHMDHRAVFCFIRFLYSSRYEESDLKQWAIHLMVLGHAYNVPALKKVCTDAIAGAGGIMTVESAVDMLLLARRCDAPRLRLLCERFIVRHFKEVVVTEGWKVMMESEPEVEKDLLEAVVEAEGLQEERRRQEEEAVVFRQLSEAMDALLHICRDGCGVFRRHGQQQPQSSSRQLLQTSCMYGACQNVQDLLLHFANCQVQAARGCPYCRRMWQLLELHSRMCQDRRACPVVLCEHLKKKRRNQDGYEEAKWRALVQQVSLVNAGAKAAASERPCTPDISLEVCRARRPFKFNTSP